MGGGAKRIADRLPGLPVEVGCAASSMRLYSKQAAHCSIRAANRKSGYAPDEQAGRLLLAKESSLLRLPVEADAGRANSRYLRFATLCRKTFPGMDRGTADPSAPLGMTKGRVSLPFGVMAVMIASRTSFVPFPTCRRQVRLLLMTRASGRVV